MIKVTIATDQTAPTSALVLKNGDLFAKISALPDSYISFELKSGDTIAVYEVDDSLADAVGNFMADPCERVLETCTIGKLLSTVMFFKGGL